MSDTQKPTPDWQFLFQVILGDDRRVKLPVQVKELVESTNHIHSPGTYWHYDQDHYHLVLSDTTLEKPRYQLIGHSKIFEKDSDRIRIPKVGSNTEPMSSKIKHNKGKSMFYFAHSKMTETDPTSVYLLFQDQINKILSGPNTDQGFVDELQRLPEFL